MNAAGKPFAWECRRLLKHRRVWMGLAIVVIFEVTVALMLMTPSALAWLAHYAGQAGRSFDQHFTAVTLAVILLSATNNYATSIFSVMVAADIAAGENARGTLRALLCRPVSRARVLLEKLAAACALNLLASLVVAVLALLLGHWLLPRGPLLVYSEREGIDVVYAYADGLLLFCWAAGFRALSSLAISAIGFFWSCLPLRPAAAPAGALACVFLDQQLRNFPAFESFGPWFLTSRLNQWIHVFDPVIDWRAMSGACAFLLLLSVAGVGAGCWLFSRRDLKP